MARRSVVLLTITIVALSTIGCRGKETAVTSEAPFDVAAMRPVIEALNREFTNAHVISDSAAMVNIFTKDARVLGPDADPVIGRAAIEVLTAQYLTFGITEFKETTVAFYGNEDLLIDEGTYVMVYGKEKTRDAGKYVNIWMKEDGVWRIHSNMWNSNAPAAQAR